MDTNNYAILAQRISVLETEWKRTSKDISNINTKLDALLTFKNKGLGAVWLVTTILIVGSGVAAFVSNVLNSLGKSHV